MKSLTLVAFSLPSFCLWLVFASSLCTLCFCNNQTSDDKVECIATERLALIQFKNSLVDHGNRLSSWSGEDCCSWSGVVCHNFTHRVQELHLRGADEQKLGGIISPSLIKLEQLHYLDLSGNDFEFSPIPSFLGSLQNLRYLNISNSEFSGEIPHQLGNLSALLVLDVHDDYFLPILHSENLKWIENMKNLQYLDMGGINLNKASDWFQAINTLPSLQELHFASCGLTQIPSEPTRVGLTSLIVLDLSNNFFQGLLPVWVSSLHKLVTLDLSGCSIVEEIPKSLGNLCNLTTLDLSFNKFSGAVTELLERFCECESPKMELLALNKNNLTGRLPEKLGRLKNLVRIDISYNMLTGILPRSLGNLSRLEFLDLSYNKLNGSLPESIGKLGKLIVLKLNHNYLSGIVTENHFANLTILNNLSVGDNKLVFDLVNNWIPPFQLTELLLGSCNLGPLFPSWVRSQTNLEQLDLANANISDTIPNWMWSTFSSITYFNISRNNIMGTLGDVSTLLALGAVLDVSSNHFHGELPRNFSKPDWHALDLSSNNLSGSLDQFLCSDIQKPQRLQVLNLANNNLSGGLPACWMNWEALIILNLENNRLSGKMPSSLGNISSLESLDIQNNKLSGEIPLSLLSPRKLLIVKLGENELTGRIPAPIGRNDTSLIILSLRSNKLSGEIPNELCRLNYIQILDLADNNLSGYLPKCFTKFGVFSLKKNLSEFVPELVYRTLYNQQPGSISLVTKGQFYSYSTIVYLVTTLDLSNNKLSGSIPHELVSLPGLRFLNLSNNRLIGRIPNIFGAMKELESLDLSVNHLNGEIPLSLAGLTGLSLLNVSYNNLTGTIPTGRQLQTFNDESSFIGNALCGSPLAACSRPNSDDNNGTSTDHHEEADSTDWIFVICMIVGLAVGFWITIGALIVSKRLRYAYYLFLDEMGTRLTNFILLLRIHVSSVFTIRS